MTPCKEYYLIKSTIFYLLKPIFLQRNLSYMRHRMSRSHGSRAQFRVDDLLHYREGKKLMPTAYKSPRLSFATINSGPVKFYNIILMGLTDGQLCKPYSSLRLSNVKPHMKTNIIIFIFQGFQIRKQK